MDVLCDTLMVEEILPRLLPKSLLCLRAASRRYNALTSLPDFAARYWQRAGIFCQLNSIPVFLSGGEQGLANDALAVDSIIIGANLAFLPSPSDKEKAYLRRVGASETVVTVVHSAAGLLLCSRGYFHPVHFYVCNPVTWQWVALPELPWPSNQWQSGLLTLDTKADGDGDGAARNPMRFKVVLFNHPMHWQKPDGRIDLRLFSSDTGQWKVMQLRCPIHIGEDACLWAPKLGQSGTAYWMKTNAKHQAVTYNSVNHTVQVIPLPRCVADGKWNRFIGERHGGGLRYAHSNLSVLEVWDSRTKSDGTIIWMLAHRLGAMELLERNPEAASFLLGGDTTSSVIKPIGFHPTNDDVVFLGLPRAVATYSIENGTLSLQCTSHYDLSYSYPDGMFPFVHPPYPLLIPAINNSIQ
ncbi:hypothetical protein QOZ80_1AG0021660 [Eleusine coracana subsp. coracana]|nr:hypothetical protein QOZ80_1AG0021660 [Eleusine coracana subsp. coracana]